MKNSSTYSKKIKQLFGSLKKKYPTVVNVDFEDPVEAIVYAIVGSGINEISIGSVMKKIKKYFVDLNDLRVSRSEEIMEILGSTNAENKKTTLRLTEVLNAIFNRYDRMSLSSLKEVGKRQAKKEMGKLKVLTEFETDYCFLTSLGGHTIPLTEKMYEYLRLNELVHPDANNDTIKGFLERQITAANGYKFYYLLRRESENGKKKKGRKKTTAKNRTPKTKTAKPKTTAKKTAKKKTKKTKKVVKKTKKA